MSLAVNPSHGFCRYFADREAEMRSCKNRLSVLPFSSSQRSYRPQTQIETSRTGRMSLESRAAALRPFGWRFFLCSERVDGVQAGSATRGDDGGGEPAEEEPEGHQRHNPGIGCGSGAEPRPRAETSCPGFPSFRFCIISLHLQFRQERKRAVTTILPIFCLIPLTVSIWSRTVQQKQLHGRRHSGYRRSLYHS